MAADQFDGRPIDDFDDRVREIGGKEAAAWYCIMHGQSMDSFKHYFRKKLGCCWRIGLLLDSKLFRGILI